MSENASLASFYELLTWICIVSGSLFAIGGLKKIHKLSKENRTIAWEALVYECFILPAILLSIGTAMNIMTETLFGSGTVHRYPTLAYSLGGGEIERRLATGLKWFFRIVTAIGWMSFVKGFFVWKDVSQGRAGASKAGAMTYVVGGVCCANFATVIDVIQTTLGFKLFHL